MSKLLSVEDFVLRFFFVSKEKYLEEHILVENCGTYENDPRPDLNIFFSRKNTQSLFEVLNTTGGVSLSSFMETFNNFPEKIVTFYISKRNLTTSQVLLRQFGDWSEVLKHYGVEDAPKISTSESDFVTFMGQIASTEESSTPVPSTSFGEHEEGTKEGQSVLPEVEEEEIELSLTKEPVQEEPKEQMESGKSETELPMESIKQPSAVSTPEVAFPEEVVISQPAVQTETIVTDVELLPHNWSEVLEDSDITKEQFLSLIYRLSGRLLLSKKEMLTQEQFETFIKEIKNLPDEEFKRIVLKILRTFWRVKYTDFVSVFVASFLDYLGVEED